VVRAWPRSTAALRWSEPQAQPPTGRHITCVDHQEDTVLKRIITTLAFALVGALLVPSTALAAKKPAGLTYTTTAIITSTEPFTELPATVADLHYAQDQFGAICAVYDVTVHGSFQYWTGAYFTTMTQQTVPQRSETCFSPELTRAILAEALDCAAGTFRLERFTNSASVTFVGSDGSTLFDTVGLLQPVLTATTDAQRAAICDLAASLNRLSDKKLLADLNKLLAVFSST
jgi:hypothetical protein